MRCKSIHRAPPRLFVTLAALVFLSCSQPPETGRTTEIELTGSDGTVVGSAILEETENGVHVEVTTDGLEPGDYRYALFDAPSCEPPDFLSAGEPYPHGAEVGMLQNVSPAINRAVGRLTVGDDGTGHGEALAEVVSLGSGSNSLAKGGGSSLVVLDVQSGGRRRACGVIRP